jgi:hypothetical protein
LSSASANALCPRRQTAERLQTFKDRFRLQDHAFAAAKRAVIHGAVFVFRKVPQIVNAYFRQASLACPADDAVIQLSAKEVRKDREDIDLHLRTKPFHRRDAEFAESNLEKPSNFSNQLPSAKEPMTND